MAQGFIIMQIGNTDLDRVCAESIVPALEACGLDAKRVDKHNSGGLLKSEIINFIASSDIIVADLTNERPNVYLEVGYAMGIDKFRNLLLTARRDHSVGSEHHVPGGPKVHFDLGGYDILFWDPADLSAFRVELAKRIRRRQAVIEPATMTEKRNDEWISSNHEAALQGLKAIELTGYMEAHLHPLGSNPLKTQTELLEAAREAAIHTFGWPIGIVLEREEYRPRPNADGITAEIAADRRTYDYWSLRRSADFFLLQSLFEDMRSERAIFFDTRIVRVTELVLYCARLYSRLGMEPSTRVVIAVTHGGLRGRLLTSAGSSRRVFPTPTTSEETVSAEVRLSLSEIESNLVTAVKELTQPLFTVFDFFEPSDSEYAQIVDAFVAGRFA